MQWCEQGSSTYSLRYEFFLQQEKLMEAEIAQMQKTLSMIRYKCWYYEQAIKHGNEDFINEMLPEEIRSLYDHAHETW